MFFSPPFLLPWLLKSGLLRPVCMLARSALVGHEPGGFCLMRSGPVWQSCCLYLDRQGPAFTLLPRLPESMEIQKTTVGDRQSCMIAMKSQSRRARPTDVDGRAWEATRTNRISRCTSCLPRVKSDNHLARYLSSTAQYSRRMQASNVQRVGRGETTCSL
jgi:hypothetical protein